MRFIVKDESTCVCRMYRHTKVYIGPVGDSWEDDVTKCDSLTGYLPDEYAETRDFLEINRKRCENNKRCK